MREILFRGKRKSDGKWWEGNLTVVFQDTCIDKANDEEAFRFIVDPETVGQFTGLTDKNGQKIFEGDVIEHHVQGDILVNRGVVVWIESEARFAYRLRTMEPGFYMHKPETVEVIGNIHDNPELLEG